MSCARPASRPRSWSPRPAAGAWSRGSAATAPAGTRCCSCRTSTSSPRRPRAGRIRRSPRQIADGYVWGRGAVDMKAMVALEVGVLRLLAARAREAGLDPARRCRPRPAPRRAVRRHRRRGGGRLERRRLAGRQPARDGARGRRAQRGRRHADRGRRAAVLRDHGRREGLRDVSHPGARPVEPRLDAARRQRAGARRPRRDAHRGPERAPADPGRAAAARRGRRRPGS